MARLRTPVPRHRRGRTTGIGAPHPNPLEAAGPHTFAPYGYYGVGETPGPTQTVAEKLAPGPKATKAAATTPPPSKSGGTSGDLTIPGYQPETPTGTPYVPSEPGHSAEDFAKAFAAKQHRELVKNALAQVGSLAAPTPGATDQQLGSALGGLLGGVAANPLGAAASVLPAPQTQVKADPNALLDKLPTLYSEVEPTLNFKLTGEIGAHPKHLGNRNPDEFEGGARDVKELEGIIAGTNRETRKEELSPGFLQPSNFAPVRPDSVTAALIAQAPGKRAPGASTGPLSLNVQGVKQSGIDTTGINTAGGDQRIVNQFLHQAGWKPGNKQAELHALETYYGSEHNPKQNALEVWNRLHGKSQPATAAAPGRTVTLAQLEKANGGSTPAFGAAVAKFTPAQQAALYEGKAVTIGGPTAPTPTNPKDPLGGKTLGNVTQQQLAAAAKAGTLGYNKKGQVTTPEGRKILANLLNAKKAADAARSLPKINADGSLEPNEIGALLVQEGKKLGLNLTPEQVAEGIGVAEAESGGDYAANVAQIPALGSGAHIGLYSEEESGFGSEQERLNPRTATKLALERFTADGNSWYDAWVKWQAQQGEDETGSDRATQYAGLAKELVEGGKDVDPQAVKNLVDAQHAAKEAGINPTPWNGDVTGGQGNYVYIRGDAKGALNWAESAVGTQQGEPKQLHWAAITHGPEDPWCAEFTTAAMLRQGLPMPDEPAYAGTYLNWKGGTTVGTDLSQAKPGDILVFGVPGSRSEHVGIYKGDGVMISGNFSDEVAESDVESEIAAAGGLQGVVRPKYKGGKLKVKAGSLPGSSPETTSSVGSTGSTGSTGGETSSGGTEAPAPSSGNAVAERQQALANFTAPVAPTFGTNIFERTQPSEAEETLRLLTEAAGRGVVGA